uniref:Acyloxyacyl hydrolase n=1 Tax=Leptobrachium leishanense TaxID=445787 RepID=A0A8C5MUS4_9ANUR
MGLESPAMCVTLLLLMLCGSSSTVSLGYERYQQKQDLEFSIDNKISCIGCVLLVSITEQLAQVHNSSLANTMALLCSYLPEKLKLRFYCYLTFEAIGPHIIKLLNENFNADVICHALRLCNNHPDQPICHLYQEPKGGIKKAIIEAEKFVDQSALQKDLEIISSLWQMLCKLPVIRNICNSIETSTPLLDFDHDNFSMISVFRGYDWRGRDCNDLDKSVYPGKRPDEDWDGIKDTNCNGIWGYDLRGEIPYEKKFCDGTDAKGIIVLGDSAAAQFHIPPEWVTPLGMSKETFANLPLAIFNEMDWPQFSLYTGFQNSTIGGYTQSLYLKLRNLNRCNHRDYQNIAKNGGSSGNIHNYVESLSRNQQLDKPAIVFYAMIGNDVCNPYHDTLEHMTTPEKMKSDVTATLKYLDSRLPNGSHVFLLELADGRFLWNALHDRNHPIGQLKNDVKYEQFYSFLSCLQRAEQLSAVLQEMKSYKFNNFNVYHISNLYKQVIAEWRKQGREDWELIEPVDGFHPTQNASAIGAEILWNITAEFLGKENPHNKEIDSVFGDQGGH